jgi:phosphatidylethanolamine/phosphatidyl-N-methylethanolamine N-methyltransferase
LNHFSNGNKLIAAVEKVISPLCKHIGFRTDLSLNTVLEGTALQVARKEKVNPLKFWHLVECVNKKNGMSAHLNGNGNSGGYVRNGHVN